MVNKRAIVLFVGVVSLLAVPFLCWLKFRTTVTFSENILPRRVTREEIQSKIPLDSSYAKVIGTFGKPAREIRFGVRERGLSYVCDTNSPLPHTFWGFSVHLTGGRVVGYDFNSDAWSDQ